MESRWKILTLGFACGAGSFVAANLYSYQRAEPEGDFFVPFGVPFQMGGFGGFVGNTDLVWSGVVGNSLVTLSAGLVAAWLFARVWPVTAKLATRAVAWHNGTRL